MNTTINISLPTQLKEQAQDLIDNGHFSSFSDLVRTALRNLVTSHKDYDKMADEAWNEYKNGKAVELKTDEDIEQYFRKLVR